MDAIMPWLLPLILVVLLLFSLLLFRLSNRRQKVWKRLARTLELPCHFQGNTELVERMKEYRIGQRGKFPAVTAEIAGRWRQMDIHLFDYNYLVPKGGKMRRQTETLLLMRDASLRFTLFSLLPRSLSDLPFLAQQAEISLAARLSLQEHYYISTESQEPASWMLDGSLQELVSSTELALNLEGSPQALLIYYKKGVLNEQEMLDLLSVGSRCFDWFKAQLH